MKHRGGAGENWTPQISVVALGRAIIPLDFLQKKLG